MTKKTCLIAAFALCGVLSQSCQTGPKEATEVDSKQFKDYVVPSGFRLKDRQHESYSREVASWRHGHYIYAGREEVPAAASYVEANMGRHSWTLVGNEELEENGRRLQFQRGIYTADYVFQRKGSTTRMTVDYKTDYSRL